MKGVKYSRRIYALESNMSGRDGYRFQKPAGGDEELFEALAKRLKELRSDFIDWRR